MSKKPARFLEQRCMMIIIKNILPLLTIDDFNLESFKISNFEYFWLKYANKYVIC